MNMTKEVSGKVGFQVWDQVSRKLRNGESDPFWGHIKIHIDKQVDDKVRGKGCQVWTHVWDLVYNQVRVQMRDHVSLQEGQF